MTKCSCLDLKQINLWSDTEMILSRNTWCQGSKVDLGRKLHKLGLEAHLATSIHLQDLEEMNQMCVFAAQICTQIQLSLNTWSYQMLKHSLMVLTGSFAFEETTWELQWTRPFNYSKRGREFLSNVVHEKPSGRNSGLQHTLWYPFMGLGFFFEEMHRTCIFASGICALIQV